MAQTSQNGAVDLAHKPMMSTGQILLMNVGFFGIQYSSWAYARDPPRRSGRSVP